MTYCRPNPRSFVITKDINAMSFRSCQKIMILISLCILISGCSSTNPYYVDREKDALDIFSISAEYGLGAKARFGPIGTGLIYSASSYGLRGGELVSCTEEEALDYEAVVIGMDGFNSGNPFRNKSCGSVNVLGFNYPMTFKTPPPPHPYYFYTQFDVAVCVLGGVRFGFNVGELADFALGWACIDIYGDDVGIVKTEPARKVYGKQILPTVPPPIDEPQASNEE